MKNTLGQKKIRINMTITNSTMKSDCHKTGNKPLKTY